MVDGLNARTEEERLAGLWIARHNWIGMVVVAAMRGDDVGSVCECGVSYVVNNRLKLKRMTYWVGPTVEAPVQRLGPAVGH